MLYLSGVVGVPKQMRARPPFGLLQRRWKHKPLRLRLGEVRKAPTEAPEPIGVARDRWDVFKDLGREIELSSME